MVFFSNPLALCRLARMSLGYLVPVACCLLMLQVTDSGVFQYLCISGSLYLLLYVKYDFVFLVNKYVIS